MDNLPQNRNRCQAVFEKILCLDHSEAAPDYEGMAFQMSLDTADLQKLQTAYQMFPQEAQKQTARLLGDMAWDFKKQAIEVIGGTYTIRDPNFLKNKAFTVKRPKASEPIDQQQAVAASMRIDGGSGGLFTGFEEELTGKPREMRNKGGRSYRQVWSNAREGGSVYGKMLGQYRLRTSSDRIPDIANYPELRPRQFLAMILKSSAAGSSKKAKRFKGKDYALGKNKVFIFGDGAKHPRGLYTVQGGKVKALQKFDDKPVASSVGKWDWRSETEAEVKKKFTPAYILEKYIVPALEKLWKKG